jgi:WXG100 family type VII secretion target
MAEIKINEQSVRAAADVFTSKGTSLSARVESIMSTQGSLTATWTGDAADAYSDYQSSWNASATGVAESFTSIGTALETIADNFRATEDAAAGAWPA